MTTSNSKKKISVYLYIGNHLHAEAVDDFVDIVTKIFKPQSDIKFSVGKEFRSDADIVFIIEEFSRRKTGQLLREAKTASIKPIYILIATEFITQTFYYKTYNNFYGFWGSCVLASLRPFARIYCGQFSKSTILEFIFFPFLSALTTLFLIGKVVSGQIHSLKRFLRQIFYFDVRYLEFLAIADNFDYFLAAHDLIEQQLHKELPGKECIAVLCPLLSEKKLNITDFNSTDVINVKMSGNLTSYRFEQLKRFKQWFENNFSQKLKIVTRDFKKQDSVGTQFDFTFNPPQSHNWLYSSPMRIYRSIEINSAIPIVTKKFNQSEIEKIPIVLNFESINGSVPHKVEFQKSIKDIGVRIRNYNSVVKGASEKLVRRLRAIVVGRE